MLLTDCRTGVRFFIDPGVQVYKGQVIGEYTRAGDLEINAVKGKKLTNMRASGSDDNAENSSQDKILT